MHESAQYLLVFGLFSMKNKNASQPPYTDNEISENISLTQSNMNNNAKMISKYERLFVKKGLVDQSGTRKNIQDLKPSEKEAFEIYDKLRTSQSNLQAQLKQFELYLSIRGATTQSAGKGPNIS